MILVERWGCVGRDGSETKEGTEVALMIREVFAG